MAFSTTDFADDTDLERFALTHLGEHLLSAPIVGGIFHDEADPPNGDQRGALTHHLAGTVNLCGGGGERLLEVLRPLGFGVAYKVLDMLVEHSLRANRPLADRVNYTEKRAMLITPLSILPQPLDQHRDVWDRLVKLYIELGSARDAAVHRRLDTTPTGELRFYSNQRKIDKTLTQEECSAFVAAVHATAEAIIDPRPDERQMNVVAWHLNVLRQKHGFADLPAVDPAPGRTIYMADLCEVETGRAEFNLRRAREVIDARTPMLWDLELRLDERRFVGRWEDVPDPAATVVEFDPATPPAWLSERP